ncbi:MAG: nicotinate (nicotinamide) nucleotide adenylyltransferase [Candidatus Levybacteria bacterium]|nr:nicotinate (nicotinamide) nucleotide adenylyltransferase [Candidatus Levybacteria bacterium]
MRIAILGGSFDPPHRGHVLIAKRLIKLLNFDEVWFMLCSEHPFNEKLSPQNSRFEMAKYLENKSIKISDFELNKKGTSYTVDTLSALSKMFYKNQFFWIIGSDQVRNFTKWKNWQEIIKKFKLIIVPRSHIGEVQVNLKEYILKKISRSRNIIVVDKKKFPLICISSTNIRKNIKEGKSILNMVSKKIENYIIKHKLYLK